MKVHNLAITALTAFFLVSSCSTGQEFSGKSRDSKGRVTFHIGGEAQGRAGCDKPIVSILGINGEIDNAWEKYKLGNTLDIESGKTEIWYSCNKPSPDTNGRCFYLVSLEILTLEVDLEANKEYRLLCDEQGNIRLMNK